jgi:FtsP/CotA-like multicopper oxidase with cupredoxin domain
MRKTVNVGPRAKQTTRREFVQGILTAGFLTSAGAWAPLRAAGAAGDVASLRGTEFDLAIGETVVNMTGRESVATVVNGVLPAPILRWREGERVTLRVRNDLPVETSIHWHGILLPADMDGVPGISFHGIPAGGSFTYEFDVRQSGTYWYHAHSGFQEQAGLYGALVIDPREPEPFTYDREHVVLLSDWTDRDPVDLYRLLKRQPGYFNYHDRTLGDFVRDSRRDGLKRTLDVRLRFINGSAMSAFDVRIPGLEMTVVAADGQPVRPVAIEEFRLSAAEVIDVIVEPSSDAYTIFAQSLDRSGFACGTLAVREGATAAVPPLDEVQYLTMADMGHGDHSGSSSAAAAPAGDAHAGHAAVAAPVAETPEHAGHAAPAAEHAGHDAQAVQHPPTELRNPRVDMQATAPAPRLDDPGVGLRNNGRRVLAYADLRSAFPDPDGRVPERTIELHLTGHMERFTWSFDGVPFSGSEPIVLRHGERVRFVLVNDSMMEHPIHLHGMWSDLEDEAGEFLVRKHTISMPPGTRRSFRVTADAPGPWAFHCHLLYHMESGMMREVRVEGPGEGGHEHAAHS